MARRLYPDAISRSGVVARFPPRPHGGGAMNVITENRFAVRPLTPEVAAHVRQHGSDPIWGHPALTQPATGFGPCRLCLRTFREGEERRMLFTYDTYAGVAAFPQPGPVFIHADGCEPFDGDGFPPELRDLELTFEGIADGPRVIALERTEGGDVEGA